MPLLRPLFGLSEICSSHGIEDVILCPGSRSAALSLAFSQNPLIATHVISDERSGAFVGVGMALQTGKTVALVCTSGSAALNFAPAVAEAFFQEIPLLILTADRPPEWIHQYDGQTIFQREMYGKHIKKSYELPVDYQHPDSLWEIDRIVNEALNIAQCHPKGPVHINIPIREPFYPEADEVYLFENKVRSVAFMVPSVVLNLNDWEALLDIWQNCDRKMIAVGQQQDEVSKLLASFVSEQEVVVVSDIISNAQNPSFISLHDTFLQNSNTDNLQPDLLITFGKSFISKSFKQFIRKNPPRFHWHIQEHPDLIDPFQSITHKIPTNALTFLKEFFDTLDLRKFKNGEDDEHDFEFFKTWEQANNFGKKYLNDFIKKVDFGELLATYQLLKTLPTHSILHLGNSMPVRYGNLLAFGLTNQVEVFCNRGTSGIDGIMSTAVGQALKTEKTLTCLIGDVSFFYDRNALWNLKLPENLKIVLINNAGGNIFRIIDGPNKNPEFLVNFVGNQPLTAENICKDSHIRYFSAKNQEELTLGFNNLYDPHSGVSLLEIFVEADKDVLIFKDLKKGFLEFSASEEE